MDKMTPSLKLFIGIFVLLFNVFPVLAGDDDKSKEENALLWQISGNGLEKPSYLFGTIHLICAEDMRFSAEVEASFAAAEQLVLEIDMSDPAFMFDIQQLMYMGNDKRLADLLEPEGYEKVSRFFADSLGMDIGMLERVKPFFLQGMLYGQILGCQPEAYEQKFVEMALEGNKKVLALETLHLQMELFDQIPYEKQAELLLEIIEDYDESKNSFFELVDIYKREDIEAAYALIRKSDTGPESFEDALLIQRNKNWIPMIEKMTKNKSTFIAVGAGHLAGEQGVIKLLRERGYVVEAVDKY